MVLRAFKSHNYELYIRAYVVYIRPILEYAVVVWHPRLTKDINALEDVQRRYTRRVLYRCFGSRGDYAHRLRVFNLPTLELRRALADVVFIHDLIFRFPERLADHFSISVSNTRS